MGANTPPCVSGWDEPCAPVSLEPGPSFDETACFISNSSVVMDKRRRGKDISCKGGLSSDTSQPSCLTHVNLTQKSGYHCSERVGKTENGALHLHSALYIGKSLNKGGLLAYQEN